MYFCVKYIDFKTFEMTKDVDVINCEPNDEVKKALHVPNKELIVNPDCFIGIILDYIFDEVGIDENKRAEFDMITSQGNLLHIHSYLPNSPGSTIFRDREQYYVAYCYQEEVKPLLRRTSWEYSDLNDGKKRKQLRKKKSRGSLSAVSAGVKESNATLSQRTNSARYLKGVTRGKDILE